MSMIVSPNDKKETNKNIATLKRRLTLAKKSGDLDRVIAVCDEAFAVFDEPGNMWPDNWAHWQRAKDDALMEQRYQSW